MYYFLFSRQQTAYEMRISDWSSDVCSSDLPPKTQSVGGLGPVGIAFGATAVVGLGWCDSQFDAVPQALDQIGIGDERSAKSHRVNLALCAAFNGQIKEIGRAHV